MLTRQWILFCFAVLVAPPNVDAQDSSRILEQPVGVEEPSVDHQPSSTWGCAEGGLRLYGLCGGRLSGPPRGICTNLFP